MSRYIDADALIEYLKKMWGKWDEDDWYEAQAKDAMKDDIEIVNKQPTVDAVQVVRCIQTALPFECGKVYPICGWNNGVHIIGVSEQGDPVDLVCHNYGDELWDAEKTDGIECLGARFVYCADGERKDGERRTDGNE